MRLILLVYIGCLINPNHAKAQKDTVKEVIREVLYDKEIYESVFFDYPGVGEWPHVLPKGKYAFIYPDFVFQKFYPDIIDNLSVSWALERKLFTLSYISNDSNNAVFIKSNVNSDLNLKQFILFDEIFVSGNNARLRFSTNCHWIGDVVEKSNSFEVELILKKGNWRITHIKTHN